MSTPNRVPPASAALPAAAPTAAAAMALIRAATDLRPAQQKKLCTAITRAVRVLRPGEDPAIAGRHVRLDCATLAPLFRGPAAKLGMSAGRFTSFCSEVRRTLRRLDQHDPDRRGRRLASAALQALLDALPAGRRHALVDYFRFLDAAEIALPDAGQDVYERYLRQLAARTLRRRPAARAGQVAAAWNWARQHLQGWPPVALVAPGGRAVSPGLEACPASFHKDLASYLDHLAGADISDPFLGHDDIFAEQTAPAARPRPLRAVTIRNKQTLIRRIVQALVLAGLQPKRLRTLTDLVRPEERVKIAIKHHADRFAGTNSVIPWQIAEALRLLARDYCKLPKEAVDRIALWAKRLQPRRQPGLTRKNRERLRTLVQPRPRAMLLHLAGELMKRAKAAESTPYKAALGAMHATILEVLLICPLRVKNLTDLRLDRHLHRPDPREGRITHLFLSSEEVKNEWAIEWPIPPESARLIETYIRRYRPQLAAEGNPFLFPGREHRPRDPSGLSRSMSHLVGREIGVAFNLHLARHFAAWNFLRLNPGQYEIVRQILGHKSIQTTMAHYVGLEVDAAARRFDAVVLKDREATRNLAAHAFRKGRGGLGPQGEGA